MAHYLLTIKNRGLKPIKSLYVGEASMNSGPHWRVI